MKVSDKETRRINMLVYIKQDSLPEYLKKEDSVGKILVEEEVFLAFSPELVKKEFYENYSQDTDFFFSKGLFL